MQRGQYPRTKRKGVWVPLSPHSPLVSAEPDRYPAVTLSLPGMILLSPIGGGGTLSRVTVGITWPREREDLCLGAADLLSNFYRQGLESETPKHVQTGYGSE